MAVLFQFTIAAPQDVIDRYGAGAVARIERSSDFDADTGTGTWSERTTKAVVPAQTAYEYPDPTGVEGQDWYRIRFSKASPSVPTDYSGYQTPWQSGVSVGPLALETAKSSLDINDIVDDHWLALWVDAINRAAVNAVGVELGPSPDTVRLYDASEVTFGRLWVPGGIRSFITVETGDGTTWTDVTSGVRIGPPRHSRPVGEPGAYIESRPGSGVRLDASHSIRITGTAFEAFGWDAWPADLVQDAVAALQRMSLDRARGGQYPSEIAALRYLNLPTWLAYRHRYFSMVS